MNIPTTVSTFVAGAAAVVALVVGGAVGTSLATTTTPAVATVASVTSFPSPATTGVPNDVVLTAYTGPSNITSCGTVIQNKTITGGLTVHATNGVNTNWGDPVTARAHACVILENDRFVVGGGTDTAVSSSYTGGPYCGSGSCGQIFLNHVEVNESGTPTGIINLLNETGFHIFNSYIHGGDQGVNCDSNCEIHDSYLEASKLDTTKNAHMDAFSDNGGNNIVLDHNTLFCHVTNGGGGNGGCSGDLGFFGDFNPISNITVNANYFVGSGDPAYCVYTGAFQSGKAFKTATNLKYTNNVWGRGSNGKCATYGPVADWQEGNGNVACNNQWEDAASAQPIKDTSGCPTVPPVTTTTVSPPTTVTPTTLLPPPPSTTSTVAPATTTTVKPTTTTTAVPVTTTTKPARTTTTTVPSKESVAEFCAAHPAACNFQG